MKTYKFPTFEKYDLWHWLHTGEHKTREQYDSDKAFTERYVARAKSL